MPLSIMELPAIELATGSVSDLAALCASCHQAPRRDDGVPLAVWIGRPSLRAPALFVCHVCLTVALVRLGLIDIDDLQVEPEKG